MRCFGQSALLDSQFSMRWIIKARIQRLAALLPPRIGDPIYYTIQRAFGSVQAVPPWVQFEAARDFAAAPHRSGRPVEGASILEIGSGRQLLLPIALWLLGADRITASDRQRLLK